MDNLKFFTKIINNSLGNFFVADKNGKIIYLNDEAADCLGVPREELLKRTMYDLIDQGIVDNAASLEVIKTKKTVIMMIETKIGKKLLVQSKPIFDSNGDIDMIVTYSISEKLLNNFIKKIENEKYKTKSTLDYIDKNFLNSGSIVSVNNNMKYLYTMAEKIAATDSTVIIYGESGTGKEVMAKFIHSKSNRKENTMIPVNCAAIPDNLIESEFFGYDKGAFTGANSSGKPGIFEIANGSTLFLDEIGEVPISFQTKLLRVLETNDYRRIGSNVTKKTDVRIIAATNKNLTKLIKEGKFREDLYYRLNVVPLKLPALRERNDEIPYLAKVFLDEYNQKYNYSKFFSEKTLEIFQQYDWPGNVRELRNIVERMVITSIDDELSPELVNVNISNLSLNNTESMQYLHNFNDNLKDSLKEFEKHHITKVLKANNNNVEIAAEKLGVHKSGLYKKIKLYNILI